MMRTGEHRRATRIDVLGVGVDPINMDDALRIIDEWITGGAHEYVCVTCVHGVMESQRDEELRRIHNSAGLVTPDGMPLVWLSRRYGHRQTARVCGRDLMLACCERSVAAGYRHYFYGGPPGVADRLARRLEKRFPGLIVAGTYSPPFRPLSAEEDEEVVRRINDAQPDIVWVGLGLPKNEYFMAQHLGRLEASVLLGVGAAFDFNAGDKAIAPVWMQHAGLEWLFRLGCEPRRLWRRYLINNPLFVWLAFLQLITSTSRAGSPQPDKRAAGEGAGIQ